MPTMARTCSSDSTRRSSTGRSLPSRGVIDAEAASGTLMIMDTHTGSLRAWAQYPSYNANDYGQSPLANFRDLAVSAPYEPGSVMKVVTFAGGLENHAITPGTVIDERQTAI